ncbi:carboxypeptidase-like regulatory domain-containing protein [Hymenobacter sp. CRA2]|uniref:carboxypeptidase-like regulatory domain-containing protein n=1 Tax=Hymenobacter sp. CRA2 TaxID=1955620 RepID=UPI00098EA3B6|nr:carboxypeptidase-like regulatory domain-containing protein [Hymenobacter sp. CRA2]OON69815.1 hypothetical protein B0919_07775 [Hymenobacter sp. CRA2]
MLTFFSSCLRTVGALFGLVLALLLSSCSTKESVPPAPTTGKVQGVVTPLGAATSLTLTAADGTYNTVAPNATTGAFEFAAVPIGTYSLTAAPITGYSPTTPIVLMVQAGQTTTAGMQLVRDGRIRGTMSWEQDGVPQQAGALFYGQIYDSFFSLEGSTVAAPNGAHQAVSLVLPHLVRAPGTAFQGVGNYTLGVAEYPFAMVSNYLDRFGTMDRHATSYANQPVGTVHITRFDLTNRTAAGTFEFVADLTTNTSGTAAAKVRITNGRFDITF